MQGRANMGISAALLRLSTKALQLKTHLRERFIEQHPAIFDHHGAFRVTSQSVRTAS
jgi:hypothetical protein